MTADSDSRRRWLALMVLCLGVLMIVLDTTIVNVALPSIREDLHFTETSLVWVVNAYLLTFGGFLLLVLLCAVCAWWIVLGSESAERIARNAVCEAKTGSAKPAPGLNGAFINLLPEPS